MMIQKLSWHEINDLLLEATSKIRLVLPSLHEEWAMLIEKVVQEGLTDIKVCINNSEKYMRDGFGDEKSIILLKRMNIEIVETSNNRISLISADNNHYLFFPTSRVFESLNDEDVTNAIQIDDLTAIRIRFSFFSSDLPKNDGDLSQTIIDSLKRSKELIVQMVDDIKIDNEGTVSTKFDEQKFEVIKRNLKINPVQSPDLKREIEVYTTKIQFVELKFENGKINGRRVKIPAKAMPFQSEELKRILESSMRIFSTKENALEGLKNYKQIQIQEKAIRKKYLKNIHCRNDKGVIEKNRKGEFESAVKKLNELIQTSKEGLIKDIDEEIKNSKKRLKTELIPFFRANTPPDLEAFDEDELVEQVPSYVNNLVYQEISFPTGKEIVENMGLNYRYYDLTPADFTDDELLKEFEQKDILKNDLNSIRELKKAFAVKK